MSIFENLDRYTFEEILRKSKSYYLNRSSLHLIEDESLKEDIFRISELNDEARNIVSKLHRPSYVRDEVDRLTREGKTNLFEDLDDESLVNIDRDKLKFLLKIAIKREFVDIIDELAYDIRWYDDVIKMIVENGNVNLLKHVVEKRGITRDIALPFAAFSGNVEMVKWILEHDIEIGEESMFNAIQKDNVEVFKLLVDRSGFELCDSQYLSNEAARYGSLNCLKEILDSAEEINILKTLSYSMEKGNLEVVKYIVERFGITQLNDKLSKAVYAGDLDIVKYLIERGADDIEGAIQSADVRRRLIVIEYLIERGADDIEANFRERSDILDYLRGL